MTRLRLALSALALLAALGCTKTTLGPPSPDFKQATGLYNTLLAKDGPTDVFVDAQIPQVVALLDKVPEDSVDHDAAVKLKEQIDSGIAESQKAAEARKQAIAEISKPAAVNIPMPAAPATPPAPAAPVEAKPAPVVGPVAGMSAAEFQKSYASCFTRDSPFVDASGAQGEAYALSTSKDCAAKYPTFTASLVLLTKDKVLQVVPKSAIERASMTVPAPPPPAPQPAAPVAQPQPEAPQPPAGRADDKITAPDNKVQGGENLNSDVDARSKLPGQP